MASVTDNLAGAWNRASLMQRMTLVGVALAMLGAGALLVNWARRPNLAMLYSHLPASEAAKVVDHIRDEGIAFELRDGGTTIYVAESEVYSLRLAMAADGLPEGGQSGYRILDDEKIGASPFTQRVNYGRALEGELAKSIQMQEGVATARVHIVRPDGKLFAGREQNPSASVTVAMRGSAKLSPKNVAAIVHLVAGSIEGLSAQNVVVVDNKGNLLSGEDNGGAISRAGSFLDYKSQVEQYHAQKAEEMLVAVLGPGRATVKVDATIETSSVTKVEKTYDPINKVLTREDIQSRSSSAVPPNADNAQRSGGGTKEENITSEYMVSETVEQRTDLPGKISGMKVAAFVDLSPLRGDGAQPVLTVEKVKEIIRNAIGVEATDIEVVDVPFQQSQHEPIAEAGPVNWLEPGFLVDISKHASLGVLVIGALLAMKMFGGRRKSASKSLSVSSQVAGNDNLLAGGEADPEALRSRITHALQENPDEVKRLFLSWVESEKAEA